MNRRLWVFIHRWAGLTMTGFLVIVGLTGSVLAFNSELEQLINPKWFPPPRANMRELSLSELALRAEELAPEARVIGVQNGEPGWRWVSVSPRTDPATGKPYVLDYDQLILDPYTGEELGRRKWGAISQGMKNLMSFIYSLHFDLALSTVGMWILGITAFIWTIDCFIGFYLTLPVGVANQTPAALRTTGALDVRKFWRRWKISWSVKWKGSFYRVNFDLHRAGGLWLWLVLLMFAWSSVYMNLWDTAYTWTMRGVSEYHHYWTDLTPLPEPLENPALGWREAEGTAKKLMEEQARLNGFTVGRPVSLFLYKPYGVFQYSIHSGNEIADHDKRPMTQLYFDANTGSFKLLLLPTGQHAGNTFTTWIYSLHMANVFGLPYQIFVCVFGLVIVMLSITGLYIYLKKRQARRRSYQRSHEQDAVAVT